MRVAYYSPSLLHPFDGARVAIGPHPPKRRRARAGRASTVLPPTHQGAALNLPSLTDIRRHGGPSIPEPRVGEEADLDAPLGARRWGPRVGWRGRRHPPVCRHVDDVASLQRHRAVRVGPRAAPMKEEQREYRGNQARCRPVLVRRDLLQRRPKANGHGDHDPPAPPRVHVSISHPGWTPLHTPELNVRVLSPRDRDSMAPARVRGRSVAGPPRGPGVAPAYTGACPKRDQRVTTEEAQPCISLPSSLASISTRTR